MTIDKKEVVILPKWLIFLLLPMLVSAIVAYGIMTASGAVVQSKIQQHSEDINKIQDNKIDRHEFNLIIKQLDAIQKKLDTRK